MEVIILPKKHTFDYVKETVSNTSNCTLLSTSYESNCKLLHFKCSCGNIFKTSFSKFKDRNQKTCPTCATRRSPQCQPFTNEFFLKKIFSLVGDEYLFLEPYKNSRTKLKVIHTLCNHEYFVTPDKFINQNRRCPRCNGGVRKTTIIFKEEVFNKYKGEYEVVGNYIDAKTNIKLKHTACGHIFETSPCSFLRDLSACHRCNTSFGEKKIIDFLKKHKITFKHQYKFSKLKNHIFDFFIILNGTMLAIEFDGIQHYEPVKYFGGVAKFKQQKKRDLIKDNFCKENNIKLVRIPYYDIDLIDDILKEVFNCP